MPARALGGNTGTAASTCRPGPTGASSSGAAVSHESGRHERRVGVFAAAPRLVAAQLVGQAPGRDGDEPALRMVREPVDRPLQRRSQQRLLHRVLAQVEAPVATDQRAENLRRELAQQILDACVAGSKVRRGLVHQRPHLDRAVAGERHPRRDLERAFEALAVDDVEATEVLLGFEVRAVGDDGSPVRQRARSWRSPGRRRPTRR